MASKILETISKGWHCQDDVFRVFGGDKIETLMDHSRWG